MARRKRDEFVALASLLGTLLGTMSCDRADRASIGDDLPGAVHADGDSMQDRYAGGMRSGTGDLGAPVRSSDAPYEATVVTSGLYSTDELPEWSPSSTGPAGGSITGAFKLMQSATEVTLQEGISFGVEFSVKSDADLPELEITRVIRFPSPGLTTPDGRLFPIDTKDLTVANGDQVYCGYRLDHDWEMVPGVWTFEVWHKERLLASRSLFVRGQP